MNIDEVKDVLRPLRLQGAHVVVHSSLSAFGHVEGGAAAAAQALMQLVTEAGTLLMPAFTYTETLLPAGASRGRRASYHLDLPVSREIGAVAEAFRRLPGVVRSSHPTHSFAAWGRRAREMLSTQRDNNLLGPLKKLNVLQGHVVLLGTQLHSATILHLAEEIAEMPYLERRTAVRINSNGHEERVLLEKVPGCSLAFDRLEERLERSVTLTAPLPRGEARKIPVRYLLSLAHAAIDREPDFFVCGRTECESCTQKRLALEAATSLGSR
jgi:aminoglycoside 3-N-acetyltransferase